MNNVKKTLTEASIQLKYTEDNQKLFYTKCLYLCQAAAELGVCNTIIHTATRGHRSTGNKHESHWGKNKWRCCIVEAAGDGNANRQSFFICFKCSYVFIFSHATAFKVADLCGPMSPYSNELYVMDTHSKCHIWIYIYMTMFLLNKWSSPQLFGVFELFETCWSEKQEVELKTCAPPHHLILQIKKSCFSSC